MKLTKNTPLLIDGILIQNAAKHKHVGRRTLYNTCLRYMFLRFAFLDRTTALSLDVQYIKGFKEVYLLTAKNKTNCTYAEFQN